MSYLLTQALALLEEATSYTSCETWSPSLTDEINSFVINARAALAATPASAQQWQPIKTAPKDQSEFLLGVWEGSWGNPRKRFNVYQARGYPGGPAWSATYRTEEGEAYEIAGWMPLPAAPEAATPAAAPLTDEQIDDLAEPFIRDLGGDHWYSGERGISEGGAQDFARAIERAHGIGASTKESNQ